MSSRSAVSSREAFSGGSAKAELPSSGRGFSRRSTSPSVFRRDEASSRTGESSRDRFMMFVFPQGGSHRSGVVVVKPLSFMLRIGELNKIFRSAKP
ncbi:Hypothetical protein NTJ_04683 [Nesidiocoris tenuis]|uniref:Uncharacterized protein n=1 Tax=Nesidiocoris tenuis TaxID=355587 RepID=A0ABN7AKX5_9HEMI|nr:Hypothetical protein NTJ_04683 [Nesidiocoris tenuis]